MKYFLLRQVLQLCALKIGKKEYGMKIWTILLKQSFRNINIHQTVLMYYGTDIFSYER